MISAIAAARWFRARHGGPEALVLPNAWDAVSARVFADAGFSALATSSAAVAATLGYADGEQTPVTEMLAAITRIARCAGVPVTADFEAGYGLAPRELAERLAGTGVIGCNLEDSGSGQPKMADVRRQADFLSAVREEAGDSLVINARVDVFLIDPSGASATVDDAVGRARRYLAAGADCAFPILAPPHALPRLVAEISGPVNALHQPGGPSCTELAALGVARITFGGALHAGVTATLQELAISLYESTADHPTSGANQVIPGSRALPLLSGR
jgi:2-methylisocitrate lyase-like PEP mutase family enzyme